MSDTIITVTDAARHFADCVNRAHYQNQTFTLLKNGVAVARLVPAGRPICRGADLAEAVAAAELSPEEARDWQRDLAEARKTLKAPADKWQ